MSPSLPPLPFGPGKCGLMGRSVYAGGLQCLNRSSGLSFPGFLNSCGRGRLGEDQLTSNNTATYGGQKVSLALPAGLCFSTSLEVDLQGDMRS